MSSAKPPVNAESVSAFLSANPDFFLKNIKLLHGLKLPHDSGNAVSLIEKQVSVLRDKNVELRNRLTNLVDNARENDVLFDKTRRLVLALLEAEELGDFVDALLYSLDSDFQVQFSSLVIFDDELTGSIGPARIFNQTQASKSFPKLWRLNKSICGQLPREDLRELFPKHIQVIASAAITPLNDGSPIGLLAVANRDPEYYRSSMGTLFLGYIGEIINRCLPRLLSKDIDPLA
ncbi:DUF484 family protein [Halioxenophilus aromaticivorans]|uniref:DUF484 family protein n=1 Tax=Halioxenophilus aromaticivorans TaxID=1306992 RepID=A0AAV3U4W1_9ALTE